MSTSISNRVQGTLLALTLIGLSGSLSACTTAPSNFLSAPECSRYIPKSWEAGTPSAPLPQDRTVGALAGFGDAQTGQLDVANGRLKDSLDIIHTCEQENKKAQTEIQPRPWWKVW